MKRFAEIVNGWESLTIFAKSSLLGVWLGSEYASLLEVPITIVVKILWSRDVFRVLLCTCHGVFTTQKMKYFILIIPLINLTKSAISYGFGHVYWINP